MRRRVSSIGLRLATSARLIPSLAYLATSVTGLTSVARADDGPAIACEQKGDPAEQSPVLGLHCSAEQASNDGPRNLPCLLLFLDTRWGHAHSGSLRLALASVVAGRRMSQPVQFGLLNPDHDAAAAAPGPRDPLWISDAILRVTFLAQSRRGDYLATVDYFAYGKNGAPGGRMPSMSFRVPMRCDLSQPERLRELTRH